jgi:hypothetical protein
MSRSTDRPAGSRVPVSIVCVFNDPEVLESCLARSVAAGLSEAPNTELLPVDNREQAFSTAGAALNHGARAARNDVVVFVHQDVYLHSLPDLERAAGLLASDGRIGVLGAVGVDHRRRVIGVVRDRVVPIGATAVSPVDIDSLDEVLFMVRREDALREPLSEDPRLAWHAYAVEYCQRVRRAGRRAVAVDISLTHNSLTTNLARLDVAHRTVAEAYPELLPIWTTCGILPAAEGGARSGVLGRKARGAATWWRESVMASRVAQGRATSRIVLADIRLLVDEAASLGGMSSVRAVNVGSDELETTSVAGLERFGRAFSAAAVPWSQVGGELARRPETELLLLSGLSPHQARTVRQNAGPRGVVGLSHDTGLWVLVGVDPAVLEPLWERRRNRPFAGLLPSLRPVTRPGSAAG